MKVRIKAIAVICALCLSLLGITASADEMSDLNTIGSISVTVRSYDTDEAVTGGILNLYKIADVSGTSYYIYTSAYKDCGIDLSDSEVLEQAGTADLFAEYTKEHGIEPVRTETAGDPTIFSPVDIGLYIIIQSEPAEGYEALSPFLVTVPMVVNGEYVFNVDATPKTQTVTSTEEEPPVSEEPPVTEEPPVSEEPPVVTDMTGDTGTGTDDNDFNNLRYTTDSGSGSDGNGAVPTDSAGTGETFMFLFLAGFIICMGTGLLTAAAFKKRA